MGDRPTPVVDGKTMNRWVHDLEDARSAKIAELWLKGYSQNRIASEVEVSRRSVRTVLDYARKIWLERKNIALSDAIAEQLRRIDQVETEAWSGYERSKQDAVENTVEQKEKGITKKRTIRPRDGSPQFLDTVIKCVEMRCKLLGVYKPPEERAEIEAWGVTVVVDTPEQAQRMLEYQEFQSMVVEGSVQRPIDTEKPPEMPELMVVDSPAPSPPAVPPDPPKPVIDLSDV